MVIPGRGRPPAAPRWEATAMLERGATTGSGRASWWIRSLASWWRGLDPAEARALRRAGRLMAVLIALGAAVAVGAIGVIPSRVPGPSPGPPGRSGRPGSSPRRVPGPSPGPPSRREIPPRARSSSPGSGSPTTPAATAATAWGRVYNADVVPGLPRPGGAGRGRARGQERRDPLDERRDDRPPARNHGNSYDFSRPLGRCHYQGQHRLPARIHGGYSARRWAGALRRPVQAEWQVVPHPDRSGRAGGWPPATRARSGRVAHHQARRPRRCKVHPGLRHATERRVPPLRGRSPVRAVAVGPEGTHPRRFGGGPLRYEGEHLPTQPPAPVRRGDDRCAARRGLRRGGRPAARRDPGCVSRMEDGRIGRFGWKAQIATLGEFVLSACANELGLEVPGHHQHPSPFEPDASAKSLDLTQCECNALVSYVRDLPAPIPSTPPAPPDRARSCGRAAPLRVRRLRGLPYAEPGPHRGDL